jgi:hypothetical protein
MEFWGGLALVICAVALLKYVEQRAKKGGLANPQVVQLEQRLGELERRLTDIQEIVLSIDEKLERRERAGTPGA